MSMKQLFAATIAAAALCALAALPVHAADPMVSGRLDALDLRHIVVDGVSRPIDSTTVFDSIPSGGHVDPIAVPRGSVVHLEVDDGGRVTAVHVMLAR